MQRGSAVGWAVAALVLLLLAETALEYGALRAAPISYSATAPDLAALSPPDQQLIESEPDSRASQAREYAELSEQEPEPEPEQEREPAAPAPEQALLTEGYAGAPSTHVGPRLEDLDADAASSMRFFVFQPSGGFNNQRIILERALRICRILQRTCVVPPAGRHSSLFQKYNQLRGADLMEMDRVLDFSLFADYAQVLPTSLPLPAALRKLRALAPAPADWWELAQSKQDKARRPVLMSNLTLWRALPQRVVFFANTSMWQRFDRDFEAQVAPFVRYAGFFRALALDTAAGMRLGAQFVAVHSRQSDHGARWEQWMAGKAEKALLAQQEQQLRAQLGGTPSAAFADADDSDNDGDSDGDGDGDAAGTEDELDADDSGDSGTAAEIAGRSSSRRRRNPGVVTGSKRVGGGKSRSVVQTFAHAGGFSTQYLPSKDALEDPGTFLADQIGYALAQARLPLRAFGTVYIATKPSADLARYANLTRSFRRVLFSRHIPARVAAHLERALPGPERARLRNDMLGIVEQLICARAYVFVGFRGSSFSEYIERLRAEPVRNLYVPGADAMPGFPVSAAALA